MPRASVAAFSSRADGSSVGTYQSSSSGDACMNGRFGDDSVDDRRVLQFISNMNCVLP